MANRLAISLFFAVFFLFLSFHNFSTGDTYFSKLQNFNLATRVKDWPKARAIERELNPKDTQYIKEKFFPEYLEINIAKLSSKLQPNINTYLQIAQLYLQLNDKENAISNLRQAQKIDPIRRDIGQLIRSLQ